MYAKPSELSTFAPACGAAACCAKKSASSSEHGGPKVWAAYLLFLLLGLVVYHFVADGEFSAIMTMAMMGQCFAMVLLLLQSLSSGSAAGISAKSLGMEALALCCQLSSTLWLEGYLPIDDSGDWVFQAFELSTLMLVLVLLYRLLIVQGNTDNMEEDGLPVMPIVFGSFVLAAIFHADQNNRWLFDTLWMAGLFIGVLAVLPQLWLISRNGGRVQALTSHYIAMMAFSRVLAGIFMWHARFDVVCEPWIGMLNHSVFAILAAHLVHILLLADFAYCYAKAVARTGLSAYTEMNFDMV